jgi:hypothetical protein
MPLIVALLPVAAIAFGNDAHFHALMLWFVVPTSAVGFALGYRVHQSAGIVTLGGLSVAVLALVALWGHEAWSPAAEIAVNVAASFLLASAHWRNFREVRRLHRHS